MRLIKNNGKLFYTIKKFKIELQCDATTHPRKMAKRKRKRQKTANVGEEEAGGGPLTHGRWECK